MVKTITGICNGFGADQLFEFVESATKKPAYVFLGDCCTSFKQDLEDVIDRAQIRGKEAWEAEKARAMEDILRRAGPEGGGKKGRPREEWEEEWEEEREETARDRYVRLRREGWSLLPPRGKRGSRCRERWVGRS